MTAADNLDNPNNDTTYMWHYLTDKHGIEYDVIDRVAEQLAKLIEACPSPQWLRDRIDQWAAERTDTPATRTQVRLVRAVADAMESGKL
jgi:hypothetical protein